MFKYICTFVGFVQALYKWLGALKVSTSTSVDEFCGILFQVLSQKRPQLLCSTTKHCTSMNIILLLYRNVMELQK